MVSWNKILGVATVAAGTALLGMVAFSVPEFKSIYFLRIDLSNSTVTTAVNQTAPFVDLGVLGFCTDLQNGQGLQCSPAKIGYNLSDASQFISGPLPAGLSSSVNTVASGLTKVLVLHIVAFGISLLSFAFALLAFFGAPIADCCSSCFCGFAGSAAFAVFIFDIAFFELIKKRVQDVGNAGAAVMGNALYLTLFAWLLLFITPIMFLLGRCFGCCLPDVSSHKDKERY
ncbi:hypothetical protein HMN09_00208000 [Mycena chlorophos]|uniref:Pali-domain-containing protein n=1 Tax=Mycena chlorophos TaxID=658473 RepID=A0A8H6TP62_MYCCL|nr:hypothetical protein HMN09_00208000 [Mycena chlorophos]